MKNKSFSPIRIIRKKIRGIGKRIGLMDDFKWSVYYDEEYADQISELEKEYTFVIPDGKYSLVDGKIVLDPALLPLNESHRALYEAVYALRPHSILEVGCGCGDHLVNMKKILPEVTLQGFDLLEEQLQFLFKRHPELKKQAHLAVQDVTSPSIKKDTVDVVFTQAVLMHIQKYEKYLSALRNMFAMTDKSIVLMENWTRHNFVEDIKKVSEEAAFPWEKCYFSTYDTGKQNSLILSPNPLSQFGQLKNNQELLKYYD